MDSITQEISKHTRKYSDLAKYKNLMNKSMTISLIRDSDIHNKCENKITTKNNPK